jgi:catechol 2,3-dioxygenase-like lactoylglutathione lyase family enzyme
MAITGFDHVQIAIPEGGEDEARAFFTGLLGMKEVAKPANLSRLGCWFESGSASLHIGVDPDFTPAKKAHPAFLVDNIATLRAALADAGFPLSEEKPIEGYMRFFTKDPFGNRIEIMQRAA